MYGNAVHGVVRRDSDVMRERPGYRETVEWLTEQTNGKGWLSTTEIAAILGIDRHTVTRRFGINRGCALPVLARRIVEESR